MARLKYYGTSYLNRYLNGFLTSFAIANGYFVTNSSVNSYLGSKYPYETNTNIYV